MANESNGNNSNNGNGNGNINITSNWQSGGITAHTVNLGPQPRRLGDADVRDLSKIPKSANVKVVCQLGDGEAHAFATETLSWLRVNGYQNVSGVDQVVTSSPMHPQAIAVDGNNYVVEIGSNR
jgi:hypothetical protein